MSDGRDLARQVTRELSEVHQEQGYEPFLDSVRDRLGAAPPEDFRAVLFGAFAVELDRVTECVSPNFGALQADALHRTVKLINGLVYTNEAEELVRHMQPSDEFTDAVGANAAVYGAFRLTEGEGDDARRPAQEAAQVGRGTMALSGVALLPITASILHVNGVAGKEAMTQGVRSNGARLLTGLALSQDRFEVFQTKTDRFTRQIVGTSDTPVNEAKAVSMYNAEEADLAAFFDGSMLRVSGSEGMPSLVWAREEAVEVGCPVTLMRSNFLRSAWGGVVDLAAHAGYFDRFECDPIAA